jgi:FAD/FMN-containing dehydrogenase
MRSVPNPPDAVALPETEQDIIRVLDWCAQSGAKVIPYGGGSSVVKGIEPTEQFEKVVTMSMRHMDKVLEVDPVSQAARIQGGIYGPHLEDQLRDTPFTMRHYMQAYRCSTLGGWIATRSGGHYATLYTHIDDFVESTRTVTPTGTLETRRLPGSGAGPSPDRMVIGSEGILGIITEAWVRLRKKPKFRTATVYVSITSTLGPMQCAALRRLVCILPIVGCWRPARDFLARRGKAKSPSWFSRSSQPIARRTPRWPARWKSAETVAASQIGRRWKMKILTDRVLPVHGATGSFEPPTTPNTL